jgi:formiminoglutamase
MSDSTPWNNYEEYFQPVSGKVFAEDYNAEQLGARINYFNGLNEFPDIDEDKPHIAILGIGYDAGDLSAPLNDTPDAVRYWIYKLYAPTDEVSIVDLGNFSVRTSLDECCNIFSRILSDLLNRNVIPLILGGGRELMYAMYLAFARSGRFCNICEVSPTLNFTGLSEVLEPENVLGRIMNEPDSFLFQYSNLGYQTYFTPPGLIKLFDSFFFDIMRLGELRKFMEDAEPILRDAHCLSIDLSSVKRADAPNTNHGTPNGLFSDEVCRISRYAGISQKLSCAGFFGLQPGLSPSDQDTHLMAQAVWHLFDGFYARREETLDVNDPAYLHFIVTIPGADPITFYKNQRNEKWWMGVPAAGKKSKQMELDEYLVPCSETDYSLAMQGEIPERWLKRFNQLND